LGQIHHQAAIPFDARQTPWFIDNDHERQAIESW